MGVILSPEFKEKVVEVSRPSDRLTKLKLMIAGEIFNRVSAYAPQSVETEKRKEEFLKDWEDLLMRVPRTKKIVVGADLNRHVGNIYVFFKECMEEKAMATGTERGENLGKHGDPRLGTSKDFIQQKGRASDHL